MEVIDKDGSVIAQIGQGGLTVTPHPLTLDGQRHVPSDLIPGESLASFLRRHVDNIDSGTWFVSVNGYEVPQAMWAKTRPKHGTLIECRSMVRKGVIQMAAIIALTYFTMGAGGLAAGVTAGGVTTGAGLFAAGGAIGGGALAAGAAFVAGSMIINKVLGPKQAGGQRDSQASPTYALSGGRNRARQYEPIGLLFGELRVTPDYASNPYTWFAGEDQYLYSVFHAGINVGSVYSLRIGKTPIESYSNVETRASGFSGMAEQGLDGWTNVDSTAGAQLTQGVYVTRTSAANAVGLQVDLEGSLFSAGKNGPVVRHCGMTIEYRQLPAGPWLDFFDFGPEVTLAHASTKPLRVSYTLGVPLGQYEVRVRKNGPDENGNPHMDLFTWAQLKTIQPDSGTYGGMSRFGLKIKSSGQLNGTLDEINWVATAKAMPYWNGSAWTTATTRANGLSNPGAQMLLFARGIKDGSGNTIAGLGFADSQIDIESLQGFMVHCAAKGFTFDHYVDSPTSCQELLDAMALAGMGSISWQSGKLGVVWAASDQPISGVVNMATMKAKSFSVNYQLVETADGIEYNYFDRDRDFEWKPIRVAAPGVTTVLNPHRITAIGVTTEAHAAVMARFHMAQSVYQRKDISFEADLEHLTYGRMSVMALSHDVTQWGYGGRLHSVVNNAGILTLELDEEVPATAVSTRYIGLRVPGEKGYRVFGVASFSGSSRTITLSEAWPGGVAVPGSTSSNPAHDTLWMYDFKSTPGYKVRVVAIQPQANLSGASVSVVPEGPEFWDYVWNGTYTPPPNQSLLQIGVPTVSRLEFSEELKRQGSTFYVELTVTFDIVGSYSFSEVWGSVTGSQRVKIGETTGLRFQWRGSIDDVWTIEVRPLGSTGRSGGTLTGSYAVAGLSVSPPDIENFSITNGVLSWAEIVDVADLAGYKIRFQYGLNFSWADAADLHKGLITESPWRPGLTPPGEITLMIKAVDTSGNESDSAARIAHNFGDPLVQNLILEYDDKAAGFPGTKSDCSVVAGDLSADDSGTLFWGADNAPFWGFDSAPFWATATYKAAAYTARYTVQPDEAGSRLTLLADIAAASYTIEYRFDTQGLFWGNDANHFWPADSAAFWPSPTEWQSWPGAIEDVPTGLIEFRITMQAGIVRGVISTLTLQFDVEDEREILSDVVISASGTRLPVTKNYRSIKIVNWSMQDDGGTAERILVADKLETGPLAYGKNGAGANVAALSDFEIIGVKG